MSIYFPSKKTSIVQIPTVHLPHGASKVIGVREAHKAVAPRLPGPLVYNDLGFAKRGVT